MLGQFGPFRTATESEVHSVLVEDRVQRVAGEICLHHFAHLAHSHALAGDEALERVERRQSGLLRVSWDEGLDRHVGPGTRMRLDCCAVRRQLGCANFGVSSTKSGLVSKEREETVAVSERQRYYDSMMLS